MTRCYLLLKAPCEYNQIPNPMNSPEPKEQSGYEWNAGKSKMIPLAQGCLERNILDFNLLSVLSGLV